MLDNMTEKGFSLAVCEAVCRCIDMELEKCEVLDVAASFEHKYKMNKILCTKRKIPYLKKRIAVLVAAVLMLFAGITVYAHYTSSSYLIEIIETDHVDIAFRAGAECHGMLRARCSVGYVTDGFYLVNVYENDRSVSYVYEGDGGEYLHLSQFCLGEVVVSLPSKYEIHDSLFVRGYKTWCFESEQRCYYIYNDGSYAYLLECDSEFSREQVRLMLDGFVCKD